MVTSVAVPQNLCACAAAFASQTHKTSMCAASSARHADCCARRALPRSRQRLALFRRALAAFSRRMFAALTAPVLDYRRASVRVGISGFYGVPLRSGASPFTRAFLPFDQRRRFLANCEKARIEHCAGEKPHLVDRLTRLVFRRPASVAAWTAWLAGLERVGGGIEGGAAGSDRGRQDTRLAGALAGVDDRESSTARPRRRST